MLKTLTFGEATDQPPLLIAHGLYGSARNWGVVAKRLSADRQVLAVDMRNHGDSPWSNAHSYPDMAQDLAEVIEDSGGRADLLGHSMGGKAAMVLATARPELIRKLVIADIAPTAYGHNQMRYVEAMQATDLTGITRRSEADVRLAEQVADANLRAFFLQSLDVSTDPPRWRLNLQALSANMPLIMGFPDTTGAFGGPTLFLSGANSDYVLPDHRPKIRTLFPKAQFVKIPDVGHWLHAEKPREFMAAVWAFLTA